MEVGRIAWCMCVAMSLGDGSMAILRLPAKPSANSISMKGTQSCGLRRRSGCPAPAGGYAPRAMVAKARALSYVVPHLCGLREDDVAMARRRSSPAGWR